MPILSKMTTNPRQKAFPQPKRLTQQDLYELCRDLELTYRQSTILITRLQSFGVCEPGVRVMDSYDFSKNSKC